MALAATSLVLLAVANWFPVLGLRVNDQVIETTVFRGASELWREQRYELALLVFAVAIAIPLAQATTSLVVSWKLRRRRRPADLVRWARWSTRLAPWGMTEVYLLGALVAFVKLDDLASVIVGPALYAFAALTLLTAWAASHAPRVWAYLRADIRRG